MIVKPIRLRYAPVTHLTALESVLSEYATVCSVIYLQMGIWALSKQELLGTELHL